MGDEKTLTAKLEAFMEQMTTRQQALEEQLAILSLLVQKITKGDSEKNNEELGSSGGRKWNLDLQHGGCMVPRYSMMEFPTYDGAGDPLGWLKRCELFFGNQRTNEEDKVIWFLIWAFTCCKIGWDSVMRMSADLRDLFLYEAFLYYNPLLLVTMMVWLWGVCLWVFSQSTINYAKIFDLDSNHLTHREIWKSSIWMTVIVPTSMTAYLYLYSHGEVALAASQPV
ncbi:hypothetical protein GOBAR_DD24861 [Gossypium barbadense]|nr:hypothetical protein GOBAR_DD24861 [Gossypium barbadense]